MQDGATRRSGEVSGDEIQFLTPKPTRKVSAGETDTV